MNANYRRKASSRQSSHSASQVRKHDILSRFQEAEDDIFGETEELQSFEDEFKTLKISHKDLETLKASEVDRFDDQIDEELGDFDLRPRPVATLKPYKPDNKFSPGTTSSLSPHRKKSLSEYSEDTNDTEVSSNFNEEDFEDIDNVFGNEESGIYSQVMNEKLANKKKELQQKAEIEEQELSRRFTNKQAQEEVNTLKLKDLSALELDGVDERTINYEYTRDEFEDFEDGFAMEDIENPIKLKSIKAKHSMPNFRRSQHQINEAKKFKSSMNLHSELHPKYNSRVFSKLDRIPSFYSKSKLDEMIEETEHIEKTKQRLLAQFKEADNKQKRNNARIQNLKKSMSMPGTKANGKKIGLVRYLNEVPNTTNSKMKFNPKTKNWEGNDIELMKFNNTHTQPSLISFDEFKGAKAKNKLQDNMMFDSKNLKWINLDKDEDVFRDLPDIGENSTSYRASRRGTSTFTQRTLSSTTEQELETDDFWLSQRSIDKFVKEEMKLTKKIEYWFDKDEKYSLNQRFNNEFYWEIRRMVVDEEE